MLYTRVIMYVHTSRVRMTCTAATHALTGAHIGTLELQYNTVYGFNLIRKLHNIMRKGKRILNYFAKMFDVVYVLRACTRRVISGCKTVPVTVDGKRKLCAGATTSVRTMRSKCVLGLCVDCLYKY